MNDAAPQLAGLDNIPWDELRHARGKAGNTPGFIRDLLHPDLERRREALYFMEDSLCHQGYQIHDSTLAALPYLIELVAWPKQWARGELFRVVVGIAHGNGWFQGAVPVLGEHLPFEESEVQQRLEEEGELQRGIREEILKHREVLLGLLDDDDSEVAINAMALAVVFGLDEVNTRRALEGCLAHSKPIQRANAVSAIARSEHPERVEILRTCFRQDESELVRMAAAFGLVACEEELTADQKNVVLDAVEGRAKETQRQYVELWLAVPMSFLRERMAAELL